MNKHDGSTLDSLFDELGELDEVNAMAAKKILAIEARRRMKQLGLGVTDLAKRLHTSRNQVNRILDEHDAGITLRMMFRLAAALESPLRIGFGVPVATREGRAPKRTRSRSRSQRHPRRVGSSVRG